MRVSNLVCCSLQSPFKVPCEAKLNSTVTRSGQECWGRGLLGGAVTLHIMRSTLHSDTASRKVSHYTQNVSPRIREDLGPWIDSVIPIICAYVTAL